MHKPWRNTTASCRAPSTSSSTSTAPCRFPPTSLASSPSCARETSRCRSSCRPSRSSPSSTTRRPPTPSWAAAIPCCIWVAARPTRHDLDLRVHLRFLRTADRLPGELLPEPRRTGQLVEERPDRRPRPHRPRRGGKAPQDGMRRAHQRRQPHRRREVPAHGASELQADGRYAGFDIKKYMAEKRRREEREYSARLASQSKSMPRRTPLRGRTDAEAGKHYKSRDTDSTGKAK